MPKPITFEVEHVIPATAFNKEERRFNTKVELHGSGPGVFQEHIKIVAFEGEIVIHIHLSGGHFLNWAIVVVRPDCAIMTAASDYGRNQNSMVACCDALDGLIREGDARMKNPAWWMNARDRVQSWLLEAGG